MLRIISNCIAVLLLISPVITSAGKIEAKLNRPIGDMYSHSKHATSLKSMGISCTDCHSFGVKPKGADPLGPTVPAGHLKVDKGVCHDCHLSKIPVARPNQCELCHSNTWELRPLDHSGNWRFRHANKAQTDSVSCKQCHSDKSCTQCHSLRNSLKPSVHRPGFRLHHSLEARANPQSCVSCHSTVTSCLQCHTKGGL